jgi:hypothetical protein
VPGMVVCCGKAASWGCMSHLDRGALLLYGHSASSLPVFERAGGCLRLTRLLLLLLCVCVCVCGCGCGRGCVLGVC